VSAALVATLAMAASAPAATESGSRAISYRGVTVRVPAGWPVFHLGHDSTVCVRFNRHAVYLGTPGVDQHCPVQAIGRTEAILIEPATPSAVEVAADARSGALTPTSTALAGPRVGSMARIVERAHGVVITASWNRDPGLIQAALALRSLASAARATNGHLPRAATTILRQRVARVRVGERSARTGAVAPAASSAGEVYTGLGFDACSAPSSASLNAWLGTSPYQALGIYIGGANMACSQTNLTAAWVSAESAAGWHLVPTYVGLQAPGACTGCAVINAAQAAAEGAAAAQDAVYQAQALGIGTGNPIYYDMESYTRSTSTSTTVLTFLNAWTTQLHQSGYLSGVYSSSASGITDMVDAQGTSTFTEPDDIWFAHWGTAANASDPYVPSTAWAGNQRIHQYQGGHNETYGGVQINVDSDYLDAATAAAGSTSAIAAIASAPSLTVSPQPNGSIALTPQWSGQASIASWEILGGPSTTSQVPIETIPATQAMPLMVQDAYPYFSVSALTEAGAVIGTSLPTAAPASVAVYGNSAFAPTDRSALASGTIAVPVSCLNTSPCSVQAAVFRGKRRLAHSTVQTITSLGGTVRLPVTSGVLGALAAGIGRKVRVTVSTTTGVKATRTLKLIPFSTSGQAPPRSTGSSPDLRILTKSVFVSNGWVGGVLVQCIAPTPCTATTQVTTRGGRPLATPRTQTVGSGEIAYLAFRLTASGHALLRASVGNQLPARVAVSTTTVSTTAVPVSTSPVSATPPTTNPVSTATTGTNPQTGAVAASAASAGAAVAGPRATALVSLDSYR
jgi:hypothetical protein